MLPPVGRTGVTHQVAVHLEGALALGTRAALLAWREAGHRAPGRRWQALEAGAEARPPRARLTVAASDGEQTLHLLMLAPPRSGKLRLEACDGGTALAVDLATAPPLALGDLARGLAIPERRRLLGWLLGVCPALFGLASEPELGFAARDLLQAVLPAAPLGAALRRCHVPGGWALLETAVGEGFQGGRLDGFVLAGQGGLRRIIVPPIYPDPAAAGRYPLLAAFEDLRARDAATLILIGAGGIACRRIEPARGRLPTAPDWIAAVTATGSRHVREGALNALALLAERLSSMPSYGSLVCEALRLAPDRPALLPGRLRATLAVVAEMDRRVLAVGTLTDPDQMVAGLRLRRLGASDIELRSTDLLLSPGNDISAERTFVAMAAAPTQGNARLPWRGYVVLGSGNELAIGETPLPATHDEPLERLLQAAAPLAELPAAWPLLEPAARSAAAARLACSRSWQARVLGPALLRPRASLLVPFRRAAEAARLVAMLEAEPEGGSVELVLVALEPDTGAEAEATILSARHAKSARLVLPTMRLAPSDVPVIGAEASEAPVILSAGLGIVPRVRGWLGALLSALASPAEAESGLALAGLPQAGRLYPGPLPSLAVMAGIRRDALMAAGGFAGDWLDPEHRDADLALRLLAAGYRARMLPSPSCVDTGLDIPCRTAAAARLVTALDTRRLAGRAADCRHRRAPQPATSSRPERLVMAR